VPVPQRRGDPVVVGRDEHPRASRGAWASAPSRPPRSCSRVWASP
jgi:hypothetical protein